MGSALLKDTSRAIRYLTVSVSEASEATGKCTETIRRWLASGKLPGTRFGDNGWWSIKVTDLVETFGLSLDELTAKIHEIRNR